MKKLVGSIAILIAIPIVIIAAHIYLGRVSVQMADEIYEAEQSARAGDVVQSGKYLKEFSGDWNVHKRVFATFIRHAEIDLANQSAAKLVAYLGDKDKSNFYGECDTLRMQILHIADTERFTLDNIF